MPLSVLMTGRFYSARHINRNRITRFVNLKFRDSMQQIKMV